MKVARLFSFLVFLPGLCSAYQRYTNPANPAQVQGDFNDTFDQIRHNQTFTNNAIPVSVKNFGAKGDGVTDDSKAFQAASDSIVASGKSGELLFPQGNYKLNSGLIINSSLVSIVGHGAFLDFTGLGNGTTAFTIIGGTNTYFGNPYYNADKSFSNYTLVGPGRTTNTCGMWFNTASEPGPSHLKLYNVNSAAFGENVNIGSNAYLISFIGCDMWISSINIHLPIATNAGEGIQIDHCRLFNSETGIVMENGIGDIYISHSSIDGMDVDYIKARAGELFFDDVHIEGNFAPSTPYVHVYWVPNNELSAVFTVFENSYFVLKGTRTVAACELDNTVRFHLNNTHVNNSGGASSPIIRSSFSAIGYVNTYGVLNTTPDNIFDNTSNMTFVRDEDGVPLIVGKFAEFTSSVVATYQFQAPDGGVTNPGFGFFNEPKTGFYRSGAGLIDATVLSTHTIQYGPYGASDDTQYGTFKYFSTGNGGYEKSGLYSATGVTTSTKTVYGDGLGDGGIIICHGNDGGTNKFVDLILNTYDQTTPVVVSSKNLNSPATRTYVMTGNGTVGLAMSAGTYSVRCTGLGVSQR